MKILGLVLLLLAMAFLGPLIVMWLINLVFSPSFVSLMFGGSIGYWQAFGLSFLCSWLCKSVPCWKGDAQ